MSHLETLMARDGHVFSAYIGQPAGRARGAVVVVQEIFGLTAHIRRLTDSYAADGYLAVAPALYDRIRRDLVLGYSPEELERGRGYRQQIDTGKSVLDITAAAAMARHSGKVAVVGYCWGGTLAWVASSEATFGAAVCYYGAGIAEHLAKTPSCPTMLHFGEHDPSIPAVDVERIRAAYPQGVSYLYAAGHGFNNEDRPRYYDAAAAALARSRTQAFLSQHIG